MESRTDGRQVSKGALWSSYILEALILLLLTFDWGTKILKVKAVIEQAAKSGYSADTIFKVGVILLICTIIYVIPRTAVLGRHFANRLSRRRSRGKLAGRPTGATDLVPSNFRCPNLADDFSARHPNPRFDSNAEVE